MSIAYIILVRQARLFERQVIMGTFEEKGEEFLYKILCKLTLATW